MVSFNSELVEIRRAKHLPKDISPKVVVIARREFELAHYDVKVTHVSH